MTAAKPEPGQNPEEKKEAAAPKPAPAPAAAAKPAAPIPAAAGGAPAAAAPKPAPAKPAVKPLPTPVLNRNNGRLLETRRWPDELWLKPWSVPSYRNGAIILAGIIVGILGFGALIGELAPWGDKLYAWLAGFAAAKGLPAMTADAVFLAIKVLIVLHVVLINGLWSIWWERKISAHIQSRVGPTYAGSPKGMNFHGWFQTAADGIKLLLKEDITPAAADKWVHALAPAIVVVPCVIAFAPVLFGRGLAAANIDIGTLYIFAFAGI